MKKYIYLAIYMLFLFGCKQEVQQKIKPAESPITEEIRSTILKQKKFFDAPGIAVGMINNDSVIFAEAHGLRDIDKKTPLTTTSLFHMASVSKPFVATAIIQLMEQGKINLDEKLTFYLPYYTMADERYMDITIRQMLAHTSGIPNINDYEWDKPQYDDGAAERYARSQSTEVLDFQPGSQYSYSNPAFDILCDVIAKASGLTFEDYMKQNIFEPIGMTNSTFYKPEVPETLAISPHVFGDDLQLEVSDIYPYNRRHAGSSTLHSNVEDMLLWAQVYLNKGRINGKQIFSEASYELLTTVQTPEGQRKVCLSWFPGDIKDAPIYYHSGHDTGFHTFFGFMPDEKAAIVMMANTNRFWTDNNSPILLSNIVKDDSISIRGPISFKLKDYVLTEGIDKVKEIYIEEQQREPQNYYVSVGQLDDLGYWLLDRNHNNEALDVFKFMVELEPEDSGWPDSVADAYKAMDSIEKAKEWYKKALVLDPDQDFTIRKLNALNK
ncbi:MAG: serine hydrolase domain-containing protein [Bacteroidota bacterium]